MSYIVYSCEVNSKGNYRGAKKVRRAEFANKADAIEKACELSAKLNRYCNHYKFGVCSSFEWLNM